MNFKEKIFTLTKKAIEEKKGIFFSLFRLFLYVCSFLWRIFVFFKNVLYDFKILKPTKINIPIISIGNIIAGGSGKTPFTIYLADKLIKKGLKVAIISRGYGSKIEKENKNIVICEKEKLPKVQKTNLANIVGDEPALIAKRLKTAYIIVGKNKIKSAKIAQKMKIDIILLDDGFQHKRLHRNLDVILLNAKNPFSNSHFLPRGFLRDHPKRLKKANFVIINNVNNNVKNKINKKIESYNSSIAHTRTYISSIKNLRKKTKKIDFKKIAIFCAIANPLSFIEILKENNFEIVEQAFLLDHSFFKIDFLKNFAKKAKGKGAQALLCTEKDAIKLSEDLNFILPLYYVEIDLKIVFNNKKLEKKLFLNNDKMNIIDQKL